MGLSTIDAGAAGSKERRPSARLILRDVIVVDGTGAPAYGPAMGFSVA